MSLEADLLIDRRRIRRRLSFWRVIAFLAVLVAIGASALVAAGPDLFKAQTSHIARIKIEGFVGDQNANLKMFEAIAKSNAQAVLVTIDSPGGATTGGEALYNGLRKLSEKKPTVAVIDGLGASAAYMAAIGTDQIVARRTALVGSIGVLIQFPNVARLMDTIGVKLEEVKSSPLKAAPNGFEPSSPEAIAALDAVVQDTYGWFRSIVKERRGYDDPTLARVTDGRIFTGQQALDLKLVDRIGSEDEALDWLAEARKIDRSLPIRDWSSDGELGNLGLTRLAAAAAEMIGAGDLARLLRAGSVPALDGLVSVWHPRIEN